MEKDFSFGALFLALYHGGTENTEEHLDLLSYSV